MRELELWRDRLNPQIRFERLESRQLVEITQAIFIETCLSYYRSRGRVIILGSLLERRPRKTV